MNEETLEALLHRLNTNTYQETIFLRPLTPKVSFAYVWERLPDLADEISGTDAHPLLFYFIKNEENVFVAAVLDMLQDLQWYVTPKHRRQGHLTLALKDVILPHVLLSRDQQRITIDSRVVGSAMAARSAEVARKVGFTPRVFSREETVPPRSDTHYMIKRADVKPVELPETGTPLTPERLETLRHRANFLIRSLSFVSYELLAAYGENLESEEIYAFVKDLKVRLRSSISLWRSSQKDD